MSPHITILPLGSRISVGGNIATIRWGPESLPGQGDETTWYGIEYDEPGKGKHDGMHQNIRRFDCLNDQNSIEIAMKVMMQKRAALAASSAEDAGITQADSSQNTTMKESQISIQLPTGNTGSFVKVAKVVLPTTFFEALKTKYSDEETPLVLYDYTNNRTKQVEFVGRDKAIKRMRELDKLMEINLSEARIGDILGIFKPVTSDSGSGAGPSDEVVFQKFHHLTHLSLDNNLISRWTTVFEICKLCPALQFLSLTGNRIQKYEHCGPTQKTESSSDPSPDSDPESKNVEINSTLIFPSVRHLVLNLTGIEWKQIPFKSFPEIEGLHLRGNALQTIDSKMLSTNFPNLTQLLLEDNLISDWSEVFSLNQLAKLKVLNLNRNRLPDVASDSNGLGFTSEKLPSTVTSVSLMDNNIQCWRTIGWLSVHNSIKELKIQGNPIGNDFQSAQQVSSSESESQSEKKVIVIDDPNSVEQLPVINKNQELSAAVWGNKQALRQVCIAVMPQLTLLNASEITSRERANAERLFLSQWAQVDSAAEKQSKSQSESVIGNSIACNNSSDVSLLHKALREIDHNEEHRNRLKKIHGDGLILSSSGNGSAAGQSAFGQQLIELTLQPASASICHLPESKKRLPPTISIRDLKSFCCNFFQKKITVERMVLSFLNPDDPFGTVVSKTDEFRELAYFALSEGCILRVDEVD